MPSLRPFAAALASAAALAGGSAPSVTLAAAKPGAAAPTVSEHRLALIVGNAAYQTSPLKNPVNDARAIRDKLQRMGFQVVYDENLRVKQVGSGTLIHHATRQGSTAEVGSGKHGTCTEALLSQIEEKGVPINTSLKRMTVRVREAAKGKREPWMKDSLTGDFYFVVSPGAQVVVQPASSAA